MSFEPDPRRGPRRPVVMRKRSNLASVAFLAWFAFCTILSLALTAFGVWAVYELVTWVTHK